jgi:CheY-like chemotaxis protein
MDDEESVQQLARLMLHKVGCRVEVARDGNETVRLYEEARSSGQPFDAVILDLTIPGSMGGRETIRRLREIDPKVKAIVSSGFSTDSAMLNFRDYGFCGVVLKPYRRDDLIRVLHEVLG